MKKALDLGCGRYHVEGTGWYAKRDALRVSRREIDLNGYEFINMDISKDVGANLIWDFNVLPYPFKDNSFDIAFARHVLEHTKEFLDVMNELWRILRRNGKLYIRVPYWNCDGSVQDPTHRHFFTENTFRYFTQDHECGFYSDKKWRISEQIDVFHPKFWFIPNVVKKELRHLLCNVEIEIWGVIEVIK